MEYGFDPERIAIWGESAGAYLSLMTALTPSVAELNADVTDYAEIPSGVTALVSFYAPVEFYTLYEEAGKPESAAGSFESKFLGQDIMADKNATYKTYWETYADAIPTDLKVWIQAGDADSRVPHTQSVNFFLKKVFCSRSPIFPGKKTIHPFFGGKRNRFWKLKEEVDNHFLFCAL